MHSRDQNIQNRETCTFTQAVPEPAERFLRSELKELLKFVHMQMTNAVFSIPDYRDPNSAWTEHLPFAFFLAETLKPSVFVELGTHYGNSYFSFCQLFRQENLPVRTYAVDTWEGDVHAGFYGREVFEEVSKFNNENYSHFSNLLNMTFDEAHDLFEPSSIDLLHIDGMHSYESVKHDFDFWLPLMSEKGVILLHDTKVLDRGFGVWRLMEELRERFPCIEFPHGYGLGVVCTGKNVDKGFMEFVARWKQDAFILPFFEAMGQRVSFLFKNQSLSGEIEDLRKQLAGKQSETGRLQGLLDENRKLLSEKEELISRVLSSRSWRITRPLRYLTENLYPGKRADSKT